MTDQLQSTGETRTPPATTPEHTDQDRTGPSTSIQDSTPLDPTGADRPADHGTVYRSPGHESAVDQPDVNESVADGAANQRGTEHRPTEDPAGESLDPVDESVSTGHADLDAHPDHAVGVASVPDADPEADTVDRGAVDGAGVAAEDDLRTEAPNQTYGYRADAPPVDGVPAVTGTRQPVEVDEHVEVAGGETPIVVPMPDAASVDVARADETLPGALPDEPGLALFDAETTQRFRDRWHELQLRFVDDPPFAEGQAVALVDEVVTALREAVERQRAALHDWQASHGADAHTGDTERMRVAVRRYRDFLDHLLGV